MLTPQAATTDPETLSKLEQLRARVQSYGSAVVCYSGGIDSALVLAVCHEQLGERAVGLTAVSPSLSDAEREAAVAFAQSIGARHELVPSNEMARPEYVANGPDRCFHCKTELYEIAEAKRVQWGLDTIANGTNVDDRGDHRPGLRAAQAAAVNSPLSELGFTKQDVRQLAKALGVTIWAKPASACLSSRLPYGTSVTPQRLAQIAELEGALKQLGFQQVRVRWHDKIARVEVALDELPRICDPELREQVLAAGRNAGFLYITLDLAGYRQGSHNEVLSGRSLRVV